MAAILQFRQGSKASFISSGPYISEPFFDTDTNIIHIGVSGSSSITLTKLEDINSGSFSVSGDISGSNLYLSGDITASNTLLSGDITIGGNIILGDQVQDNITVSGQFDSDLIPSASGEYDLGSITKKWNHLYAVSASIDSVDLVTNLPSGVVSSSAQIASYGFDNYGAWAIRGDNNVSVYIGSSTTLNFTGGKGIVTETVSSPTALITLDTGSNHFINAVEDISFTALPDGTVSGSQQVIDLLPSGVVSGSSQLPSGLISGSTQTVDHIESSTLIAINNTSPNNLGYAQLNINDNGTAGTSGLLVFEDGGSLKSFDYVASNIRYIDTNTGVSIAIKPDADGTKSWVFDTDGDLVSNGGNWASGNVYANNLIASSSVTASNMLVDNDITANNFIGNIQSTNGVISGSSQIINILDSLNSFSSSQESKNTTLATYTGSVDTSIDSLNLFTSSFDTAISLNSSDVTILGNLTVQGTQTQLNTSTLNVEDLNILLASGSTTSAAADGAGITIDGANKSLQWEHGTSQFVFDAQVSSSVGFKGDGSNLTGLTADSVEYDNILNKPTLVSGSEQILGGTNIVSSSQQVITYLPQGTVSGSVQVLGGTNIVSSSQQVINYLPSGTVSGSTQVLGGTNIISSSQQVINYLPSGTVSSSVQIIEVIDSSIPGVVSGSDQVTASLDTRYATLGGNDLLSSSNENFSDYSQSVDTRLLDTFASSSETSQSLHTLVGHFPTSGALGTAAFYNVSSSLSDDPSTIPNVKAVYDYINNVVQAADITGVSASLGLSGGGNAGYVSLSLDTGSAHFQAGVELYGTSQVEVVNILNDNNVISSSIQLNGENLNLGDITGSYIRGGTGHFTGVLEVGPYVTGGPPYIPSFYVNNDGDTSIRGTLQLGPVGHITDVSASISSIDVLNTTQNNRLDSLESLSSSLDSNVSTSEILIKNTDGTFTGSNSYADSNNLAVGTSSPSSIVGGLTQLTINDSNYAGTSGVLSFEDSGTAKSFDYVNSDIRYIDSVGGVSIAIKPDGNGTKSWVFDTDGDLVSNGGSWTSGNAYMNNLIASSSVTASNVLVDNDITANNFIGNIQSTNGVISGSSQVISSLPTGTLSSSVQVKDLGFVDLTSPQTISGTKTFTDIVVNGTGSFSYFVSTESELNVIGQSFIVLNNDTPTERYAGIAVYDSGSAGVTASLQFDGQTNDWFYEYSDDGGVTTDRGAVLFGPEYSTKGSPTYPTNNRIQKGNGGHHLLDSNITDTGTLITLGSNTNVSGVLTATTFKGMISGSSQVSLGGDLSGTANSATVAKVNGVSITNAEATQLGNIGTTTISSTQWGYLGATDQGLTTTSNVTFNAVSSSAGFTSTAQRGLLVDNGDGYVQIGSGTVKTYIGQDEGSGFGYIETRDSGFNTDEFRILVGGTTMMHLSDVGSSDTGTAAVQIKNTDFSVDYDTLYVNTGVGTKRVGINTLTPTTALTVNGNISGSEIHATGQIKSEGDVIAYASSDRRLKDEIQPISNPIEKINQIGGYSFVWNTEKQNIYNGKDYGVVAQEIEEILPELVQTRENGYKAVKYDKIVSLLIEGIKELSKEVEDLKKKIN